MGGKKLGGNQSTEGHPIARCLFVISRQQRAVFLSRGVIRGALFLVRKRFKGGPQVWSLRKGALPVPLPQGRFDSVSLIQEPGPGMPLLGSLPS